MEAFPWEREQECVHVLRWGKEGSKISVEGELEDNREGRQSHYSLVIYYTADTFWVLS